LFDLVFTNDGWIVGTPKTVIMIRDKIAINFIRNIDWFNLNRAYLMRLDHGRWITVKWTDEAYWWASDARNGLWMRWRWYKRIRKQHNAPWGAFPNDKIKRNIVSLRVAGLIDILGWTWTCTWDMLKSQRCVEWKSPLSLIISFSFDDGNSDEVMHSSIVEGALTWWEQEEIWWWWLNSHIERTSEAVVGWYGWAVLYKWIKLLNDGTWASDIRNGMTSRRWGNRVL